MCFFHGGAVVGMDELVQELLAGIREELRLLVHRCCPSRYASYSVGDVGPVNPAIYVAPIYVDQIYVDWSYINVTDGQ